MIAEKLFDNVYYYKNVIEDPKELVNLIEKTESDDYKMLFSPWDKWEACSGEMYLYGSEKTVIHLSDNNIKERSSGEQYEVTKKIIDQIMGGFKKVCLDYAEKLGDSEKPMLMQHLQIKKYESGTYMGAHYDQQEGDQRLRYSLVMYLNDDYEGGELSFNIKDGVITGTDNAAAEDFLSPLNKDRIMFHIKPEAGSCIIFPSVSPYSHTAHLVKSGYKYMVPGFWMNKGKYVEGTFYPN